jgi:MFS family permease
MLGVSGVFMSVPFLLTSLYGGALADRMDRHRLLLVSQSILAVLAWIPVLLAALDLIRVWHLYVLSCLTWTVGAFDAPARQALIPGVVSRSELMSAIALTSILRRVTALVGPLIGGAAISFAGAAGGFFLHAVFCLFVVLTLWRMKVPPGELRSRSSSMVRSILDGLSLMRKNKIIFGILTMEAMNTFFASYQELMPVFARDVLRAGPTGLGLLYASPGVGALVASLVLVSVGDVRKKGKLFLMTSVTQPIAVGLFALSPWMPTSMAMLLFSGMLEVFGGTVRNTMLQLSTDDAMRGRVMSMNMMVHRGLGPLSGIQAGSVATFIGAPFAISGGSALVMLYAIVLSIRLPELHRYRGDESPPLYRPGG